MQRGWIDEKGAINKVFLQVDIISINIIIATLPD